MVLGIEGIGSVEALVYVQNLANHWQQGFWLLFVDAACSDHPFSHPGAVVQQIGDFKQCIKGQGLHPFGLRFQTRKKRSKCILIVAGKLACIRHPHAQLRQRGMFGDEGA